MLFEAFSEVIIVTLTFSGPVCYVSEKRLMGLGPIKHLGFVT